MTFDQVQSSMDRILQESIAFYDPAVHSIVFVYLPSRSGNSVAIWRRKVSVPNNLRLAYQKETKLAMAALRSDYVLHVDECVQASRLGIRLITTHRLPEKGQRSSSESKRRFLSKQKAWFRKLWTKTAA